MFAPPNLLSNLCRGIATTKQGGTERLGESVDQYALRISSPFTRLLAESQRNAPFDKSPEIFAWKRLKIAVFENGCRRSESRKHGKIPLTPSARDRAYKNASNNLQGVNATILSSVVSTPPPPLKNQLETRLHDVQATIASLVEAPAPPKHHKRGRSKTERRAAQGRQDSSVSRWDKSSSTAKFARVTRPKHV